VGAAVAAAALLGLDDTRRAHALRLALIQAAGLHAAFGSDGKSLQVGLAAAAGVTAARLARAGASASAEVPAGFEEAFGARWIEPAGDGRAGEGNWIKAYPCCLQTHSSIEAAAQARAEGGVPGGPLAVAVHPVSRLTAFRDDVDDGLQAKFSIPYLTAYTLLHGAPRVESFAGVDDGARTLAERITVRTDATLLESEAVLEAGGEIVARVETALGSPGRPMDAATLAAKVRSLAGTRLDGVLDDPASPVRDVADAAGLPL
jgi:2-methylcitrate dehydratase PrpD